MPKVSGSLKLVTGSPSAVSQVWLRAPHGRTQSGAYVTEAPDTIQVTGGAVSFDALPGALVMTLVSHGAPLQTVKLLVPDKATATLAECIEAAELATDGTRSALERLAFEVRAELGQVPALVSDALAQDATFVDAVEQAATETLATKADKGHKHPAADITEKTINVGDSADQYKMLYLDVYGKLRVDTSRVTGENDVASKGYVDSEVSDVRFARTWLTSSSDINALPREDIYGVINVATAQALALPEEWWGKVHEHWINANGTIRNQIWEYWKNGTLNIWARQFYGGNWTEWVRILPVDLPEISEVEQWSRGAVTADVSNIDSLADGVWRVTSAVVSRNLGLPGQYGNLQIMTAANSRTAWWLNTNGRFYVAVKSSGTWGEFTEIGATQELPEIPEVEPWSRGAVTADVSNIDSLADGMWKVASAVVSQNLGLPGQYGNLQIMTIANSRTAWWLNTNGRFYVAVKSSGVWSEFTEIGATQEITPPAESTNEWYKTLPMAVTTGSAVSYRSPTSGLYRVLTQVTAPVSRFRVHVDMRHSYSSTEVSGATLKGISIGHRDGTQGMTNLTNILTSDATVAADGEWVSDWVRHDLTQETFIEYWYEAPNEVIRMAAPALEQQEDGSWVQKNSAPFFIWMELETYAETPAVAMLGDSTGVGSGSITAVWDSPLHITARKQKFIPVLYADTGHGLGTTSTTSPRKISKWAGFAQPDSIILQAGSNDIHGTDRTLEYVTTRLDTAINLAKQLAPVVYAATIKPRRNPTPEQESLRIEYNNYLRDEYEALGLHAVVDYSQAVAPSGVISDEYSADDAHLNSEGQNAMAEGLNFPVCRPAIAQPWVA